MPLLPPPFRKPCRTLTTAIIALQLTPWKNQFGNSQHQLQRQIL